MRDLASIVKRNNRKGVGEKLGKDNGKPVKPRKLKARKKA